MTANPQPPSPGMVYATYDFYLLIKYRYRNIFGNILSILYRIPKTNIVASLVGWIDDGLIYRVLFVNKFFEL